MPGIEYFAPRPDLSRWVAMALHAPLHGYSVLTFPHQRHCVDAPVARRTTDALVDVNAVIEINKIRQIVARAPTRSTGLTGNSRGPAQEFSALAQICEWQLMQVSVGGNPAKSDVSTDWWQ